MQSVPPAESADVEDFASAAAGCVPHSAIDVEQTGPEPSVVQMGVAVLDRAYTLMSDGRTTDGVQALISGLNGLRSAFDAIPDDWTYFAENLIPDHPVSKLLCDDPTTVAAHSGDENALLDYIYDEIAPEGTSTTGIALGAETRNIPLARSLRSRRSILARCIDEIAPNKDSSVLVIGTGRFYEGRISQAVATGEIDDLVVTDGDAKALAALKAELPKARIETVTANVRTLLSRTIEFNSFDLVYAPTYFDKLDDLEARRLAELMFSMIRPGGRILLVNATDALPDTAFREAFLDWSVIGRSESDLVALTNGIPEHLVGQVRVYRDEYGFSNFVEIYRK